MVMNRTVFLCILLFLSIRVYSQADIRDYVTKRTIPIRTIHPDSTDFNDLEQIGESIGDSRIVMLGEQDHGDAPTFLAKSRLINYLHKRKGFSVIVFESDFFSATYGITNNNSSNQEYIKNYKPNIVPYWTLADGCNTLFTKIIPESFHSSNPIRIAGFDNQMIYKYAANHLSKTLDSLVQLSKLDMLNDKPLYQSIRGSIDTLTNAIWCVSKSKDYYKKAIEHLQDLQSQFEFKRGKEDVSVVLVGNLIAFARQLLLKNDFTSMVNLRDMQMAETLKWVCTKQFPADKIIVWAANYHISKYMGHFKKKRLNENMSMATEFVKDSLLKNQTFIIGFTSYDGEAGRLGTKTFGVDKPDKNGFENWINQDYEYAYTDFTKFNSTFPAFETEFEMKSCVTDHNVHQSYPAQWNRMFDGVFFIRHMYPVKVKN